MCYEISLNQKKSTQNLSLSQKEQTMILDYIKNHYKKEYDELEFILNICTNCEGFNNFAIIDYNNYSQINIFHNNNSKYFSYNNEIYKINKNKIIKIYKNQPKNVNFNWDLYFLNKKRKKEMKVNYS